MAQVALNISKLSLANLVQTAVSINSCMTDNPNFKTPTPAAARLAADIAGLTDAVNDYDLTLLALAEKLQLRDDAAAMLIADLNALAGYVQSEAGGDAAKILSSGLQVKRARVTATIPGQVGNLSVFHSDNAGCLNLQWDPMPGTKSYEVQVSVDPVTPTSWVNRQPVTKSKTAIGGLVSGSKVWSRVRAVNAAGTGAWSNEIAKFVP